MATLKQRHEEYMQRVKSHGGKIAIYTCPNCQASIETPIPTMEGDDWDSLSMCPNCEQLHMKWARPNGASASKLPE